MVSFCLAVTWISVGFICAEHVIKCLSVNIITPPPLPVVKHSELEYIDRSSVTYLKY